METTARLACLEMRVGEPAGRRKVSYGYDAAGDVVSIAWPDTGANALTATYAWDVLQRVTQISAGGAVIATYAYDPYRKYGDVNTCPEAIYGRFGTGSYRVLWAVETTHDAPTASMQGARPSRNISNCGIFSPNILQDRPNS